MKVEYYVQRVASSGSFCAGLSRSGQGRESREETKVQGPTRATPEVSWVHLGEVEGTKQICFKPLSCIKDSKSGVRK